MSPTDAASLSLLEILVQRTDEWGTCIVFEQAQILEKVILRVKELIKEEEDEENKLQSDFWPLCKFKFKCPL